MASIYCTVRWPLWYTVQNNTCWFSLCVREYTVDIVLYVDINREISIFFLPHFLNTSSLSLPDDLLDIDQKTTFSLFRCPRLLLVATRWHWRVSKWTLSGAQSSFCPLLWHGRKKKKNLYRVLFLSHRQVWSQMLLQRDDREKASKNTNLASKTYYRWKDATGEGSGAGRGAREEKERDSENAKSEKERNKMKLRKCAFLLSGSALGRWRCCPGLGGWVVLCHDWVLSVKRSGEVSNVLEHLHAGLNQGRGLCVWWNLPRIWIGFFFSPAMLIPVIKRETQSSSRGCVWPLHPLLPLSPLLTNPFFWGVQPRGLACWYEWLLLNRPTNAREGDAEASVANEMNWGLWLVCGDHLTQELATLVTDMMLQRFFTIMLM